MYNEILLSVENRIATITLNRPEVSNAFALASYHEVREAIEHCGEDDEVGVIVITGIGKNFSAGGDINRFKMLIDTEAYLAPEGVLAAGAMSAAVRHCPKPVIAMINGAAAGAGCSLALACDFRIMTEKSRLVMAFVKMGLSGDTGGIYYLSKIVGMAKTIEMLMLGTPVGGREAFKIGLTTKLAEEDSLWEETNIFAEKLANSPTQAFKRQKQLISEFFYSDIDIFAEREAKYMVECSHTDDFKEAVYSFIEKRQPVFTGK